MIIQLTATNNTPVFVETGDIVLVQATPKSPKATIIMVKAGVQTTIRVKETPEEVNALMTPLTTFAKTMYNKICTSLNSWVGALNKGPNSQMK